MKVFLWKMPFNPKRCIVLSLQKRSLKLIGNVVPRLSDFIKIKKQFLLFGFKSIGDRHTCQHADLNRLKTLNSSEYCYIYSFGHFPDIYVLVTLRLRSQIKHILTAIHSIHFPSFFIEKRVLLPLVEAGKGDINPLNWFISMFCDISSAGQKDFVIILGHCLRWQGSTRRLLCAGLWPYCYRSSWESKRFCWHVRTRSTIVDCFHSDSSLSSSTVTRDYLTWWCSSHRFHPAP